MRIFGSGSIIEDFGSGGALDEISEFREQDFWIPRQILYGNDDFEVFANGSIFEDFGSSGALREIFEFREQDFWIPRQNLYGNGDFEDFCEWLNF